MRTTGRKTATERDQGAALRVALVVAPFALLFVVLLAVKSADSSGSFQIDNRLVLEDLKREIAAALPQRQEEATPETDVRESSEPAATTTESAASVSELREIREVVHKGDTLGGILRRIGLSADEVTRWSGTKRRHVSLAHLQPGRRFTFLVPSGTDRLAGLQYEVSPESTLVMREEGDEITAQVERLPRMVGTRAVSGVIETSLYAAASRQGVPDSVISSVVDIFGWEIDFSSDLQSGDTFRVVYEESRDTDGKTQGGRVIAAEVVVSGKRWDAVFFEDADDGGSYYTPEGKSFGRAFLRYPLEFTRITSQFTWSRFHPLLGVNRPHLGVDFAAPMGTPVRAIASGQVVYAGWKGGSGRYIRIDHGSGIETSYSHLQSISAAVRPGMRVQVGQKIGAVGASGLATGPHLHFALYRNGVYVNPMTVKLPAAPPLPALLMSEFARTRDQAMRQLASAGTGEHQGQLRLAVAPAVSRTN
jgi:murein DD-endopeptidase MepM/ murein hydrolase activator NlpD